MVAKGVPWKNGSYLNGKEAPEHYVWRAMLARCNCPKGKELASYVGITVCDRWRDYANFIADMGPRPGPKYSLDRIDGAGNYEPDNCRWATKYVQANNLKSVRWFEQDGEVDTIAGWARRLGISTSLAWWRWKNKGTFKLGKVWKEVKWQPLNHLLKEK